MAEIPENNAPTSGVTVGVVKESVPGETRVGLIPDSVKHLVGKGLSVVVQAGAGEGSSIADSEYEEAGARIVPSTAEVHAESDVVVRVQAPSPERGELEGLKQDQILVSFLAPLSNHELNKQLADSGVTAMAVDAVPRITRAQSMDALSAMSTISGYKAAILAAEKLPKFFPLLMTAAGTIRPAKVLVLGAGVAGLQAIATARRLGAVVEAYDVRAVVKEQVESLGAKFVEIDTGASNAEAAGGYAREATPEELKKQQEGLNDHIANSDVVITTALVPGRPAPKMIPGSAVERMRTGSVIVDLAAETGGNCELTTPGEVTTEHGVTIIGTLNLPATLPVHGSQMYGKVMTNFLDLLIKDGQVNLNFDDAIIASMAITNRGEIVQEQTRKLMGLDELEPVAANEPDASANTAQEEGAVDEAEVGESDSYDSSVDTSGAADTEVGDDSARIADGEDQTTTYRPSSGNSDLDDSTVNVAESETNTADSDSDYIPFADQPDQADGDEEVVAPLDASTEIESYSVEDGYETVADSATGDLDSGGASSEDASVTSDADLISDTDLETSSADDGTDSASAESSFDLDNATADDGDSAVGTSDTDLELFPADSGTDSASTESSSDMDNAFADDGDSPWGTSETDSHTLSADASDSAAGTSDTESEPFSADDGTDVSAVEYGSDLNSDSSGADTSASSDTGFTSDSGGDSLSADDGTDAVSAESTFELEDGSVAADDGSDGSDANNASESHSETSFGDDSSADSGTLSADDGSDVSLGSDTESGGLSTTSGFSAEMPDVEHADPNQQDGPAPTSWSDSDAANDTSGYSASGSGDSRSGHRGSSADSTVDADKLESFLNEEEFDSSEVNQSSSSGSSQSGDDPKSDGVQSSSSDNDSSSDVTQSVAATRKSSKLPLVGEGEDWVAGDGTHDIPAGFPIKGNANSGIFHPEESPSYNETIAEIYFANGEVAKAHGYRLPKMLQKLADKASAEAASGSGHVNSSDESAVDVEEESDKNE